MFWILYFKVKIFFRDTVFSQIMFGFFPWPISHLDVIQLSTHVVFRLHNYDET